MSDSTSSQSQLPSLRELHATHSQLEKEVQIISHSLGQLQDAQERFVQNIATLTSLKSVSAEQQLLIPLTSSVYVPGALTEPDRVLIDIGTGYYLEKDLKGADEYYVRKVKYLQEQMGMVAQVLSEKRQHLAMISQAIKLQLTQAQPAPA